MHQLKSQLKFQSKDKQSNPSSLDVGSSLVSTEVDYITTIDPKPTREELENMVMKKKYINLAYNKRNIIINDSVFIEYTIGKWDDDDIFLKIVRRQECRLNKINDHFFCK